MATLPTFHYRWVWDLPASPEALWRLASDTNRFNMDTGLPPVQDAREDDEELENARRRLRFSQMGLVVEWEEQPFEWVRPYRFGVVRRYARGPLDEMRVRAELEPLDDGGTRLTYDVVARPSGLAGVVAIPLGIGVVSRFTFGRVFKRYARQVGEEEGGSPSGDGDDEAAVAAAGSRSLPGRRRSRDLVERLERHEVDGRIARALATHLADADDLSAARLRPYTLADVWGLPRREALEGFLRATRAGVLDLRWDLLCPLCRGSRESAATLAELRTRGVHCDTCRIDFDADMERSVELVFTPNPGIREVEAPAFCVAGPQITPHIVVQQLLDAGEERVVRPVLEPGRYRMRGQERGRSLGFRVEEEGWGGLVAVLEDEGWRMGGELEADEGREGGRVGVGRGSGPDTDVEPILGTAPVLSLANATDREQLVVVERTGWADEAVTGAEVTALQEFRDLFSGEVLAAGEFLSVGSLAVLFTDLKGSTRMYRDLGDGPAFGRVMDHFKVLREAVTDHDGTVVKTIGDAVMAVFRDPAAAVRAAVEAHRTLEEPLVLKAAVHFGPCFVIRANERLDYFGTTVNLAARLQDLSRGGDVVLSERVREDEGVADALDEEGVEAEPLEPETGDLPGLEDLEVRAWRVEVGREGT